MKASRGPSHVTAAPVVLYQWHFRAHAAEVFLPLYNAKMELLIIAIATAPSKASSTVQSLLYLIQPTAIGNLSLNEEARASGNALQFSYNLLLLLIFSYFILEDTISPRWKICLRRQCIVEHFDEGSAMTCLLTSSSNRYWPGLVNI